MMSQSMTFDAGVNRSGYWWPDKAWTDDVRRVDLTTTQTRGAFLELNREPARYGYNGTWSWYRTIGNTNHEIKSGVLGYHSTNYVETYGYPNQQVYRYRSLPGDTDYFQRPDSVQVFEYPNNTNAGVLYNSWFANDSIDLGRRLTVNVGLRFDRYASWLPEQGNPGTGPFASPRVYPENRDFPIYNALVAARLGGVRHHRAGPRRPQGQLRPLFGGRLGRHRGRRPGGRPGQPRRHAGLHLQPLGRHHPLHPGGRRTSLRHRAKPQQRASTRS